MFLLHLDPNTEYLINIVNSGFFIQTDFTHTDRDLLCTFLVFSQFLFEF
jgi:hypothetical protein